MSWKMNEDWSEKNWGADGGFLEGNIEEHGKEGWLMNYKLNGQKIEIREDIISS